MELYLVRHGQSEGNLTRTNEGWSPAQLTDLGKKQAAAVAERLADVAADVIIASDVLRAKQTAQIIATKHPDTTFLLSEQLREWNIGMYVGTPYGTIFEKMEAAGLGRLDFPIEGGETIRELKGRVERFCDELLERYAEETVILVSHGGWILNALLYLLDEPDEHFADYDPSNTGVAYLSISGKDVTLHYYNSLDHLKDVGESGHTSFRKR